MRFGRRKISAPLAPGGPDATEPARRNRLSKPLTNRLASASTPNLQETVGASGSTLELVVTGGPLTSHPSNAGPRRQTQSQLVDSERPSPNPSMKSDSTWSVAYLVSQIDRKTMGALLETPAQRTPPPSPLKSQKRKSFSLRRQSVHRVSSLSQSTGSDRVDALNADGATVSSAQSSFDRIVDSPAIPPTRRSSFAPGTATRQPSAVFPQEEAPKETPIVEVEETPAPHDDHFDWQPPALTVTARSGTPADLGYSHLAGLRHGSLRIVNGRASPALSELSKMSRPFLSAPTIHRDISSDYGDAADDDDADLLTPRGRSCSRTTPAAEAGERRDFSWESNDDKRLRAHSLPPSSVSDTHTDATTDDDQTSLMAKEYMAELPASPYSERKSGSFSCSTPRSRSNASDPRSSSLSSGRRSPSFETVHETHSPVRSFRRSGSPTGSIVRRSRPGSPADGDFRKAQEPSTMEDQHSSESAMSWYSTVEPKHHQDEPFQSTLEFQVPPDDTPFRPGPPRAPQKSDSGYESNKSLRSLQLSKDPQHLPSRPLPAAHLSKSTTAPQQPFDLDHRPSILKRQTEPTLPTFTNLRPAPKPLLDSTPAMFAPGNVAAKPQKARKRLQKKRPLSQPPGKIAVTRAGSFDGDTVPQVSHQARENLRIRSQEVPELDRTYLSMHDVNHQASTSGMAFATTDIRFPSPAPEQPPEVRRARSRSRPRSWIGRAREDHPASRRYWGISQVEAVAIINDFGTVAASLGRSPYDPAHEHVSSGQTMNPYNISTVAPRPRRMMDDETAAEVARIRSRSIQERDSTVGDRRLSFNDRGGIPGKNLRPASFANGAPPITPELLQRAYRISSVHRQVSMGHDVAPTPPPHSPRPSYVDYEEDYSDVLSSPPPPPPSHSPRPRDITQDLWQTGSLTWGVQRMSAASPRNRPPSRETVDYDAFHDAVEDDSLWPVIPPRHAPQPPRWSRSEQCPSPDSYLPPSQRRLLPTQKYARNSYYAEPHSYSVDDEPTYEYHSRRASCVPAVQPAYQQHIPAPNPHHGRPLPSSRTEGRMNMGASSRPHSRAGSTCSFASSLAEELHPADRERPHPPPDFGRYSGGMHFAYEKGYGFGGSAGTRSVSGKNDASRKGVPLRASFGVDLGDVPVGLMVR